MFGYIKPDKENLYVKELHLYKAVYCGLCDTIKKKVSFILPMTLSYDFVFLTMVRATLTSEGSVIKKGSCKYNPFKKVSYCTPMESALFSGRTALLLTYLNILDDINDKDTNIFKKISLFPLGIYFKIKVNSLIKKCPEYFDIFNTVKSKLSTMQRLEKEKSSDIDRMCELFGDIMSYILSYGLDTKKRTIAHEIGSNIGRYIYLADAIDDVEKDKKRNAYNPLIEKYGVEIDKKALDIALAMYTENSLLAFNLLEYSDFSSIINNILKLGLGKESYRIFTKNGEKND